MLRCYRSGTYLRSVAVLIKGGDSKRFPSSGGLTHKEEDHHDEASIDARIQAIGRKSCIGSVGDDTNPKC